MPDQNNTPERVYIAWPNKGCGLAFDKPANTRTEYIRADRAAPEGQVVDLRLHLGRMLMAQDGVPLNAIEFGKWVDEARAAYASLTPPPAAPTDNTALVEALRELTKQGRKTWNLGAQTGSHWVHLGAAVSKSERILAALASRKAPPAAQEPVYDDSLCARVCEIGIQVHNIACEHQDDEALAERLGDLRGQLWDIAAALPKDAAPPPAEKEPVATEMTLEQRRDWIANGPHRVWLQEGHTWFIEPVGKSVRYTRDDLAAPPPACQQEAVTEACQPLLDMEMWTESAQDNESVIVSVGTIRRIRTALRALKGSDNE